MTSAETSVTKEGMLAAAERMESALTLVRSERGDVEGSITRLFGSFSGEAAMTYRRAMTGWFQNVQEIESALNNMISIMRTSAETVGKADSTSIGIASAASSRIASPGLTGL